MASGKAVTKIAHVVAIFCVVKTSRRQVLWPILHSVGVQAKIGSNIIVFEIDSLFSDFGRFVIVGFFVDPPAVGPVFPVEISQVIAMLGTGQKAGNEKNEDDGRRDEPASGNERSHDGTHTLALSFIVDGFVKKPISALRFIPRHCGVPSVRLIPKRFAGLDLGIFTNPSEMRHVTRASSFIFGYFVPNFTFFPKRRIQVRHLPRPNRPPLSLSTRASRPSI